ncbi:hypothetical protein ACFWWT_19665 [Streptomyces sp. NPDC058676]|uniref:hypothetical protein n=1 Tax=unclassified Streptomyces TaxID=2593676 RepID=UPI00366481E8
MSTASRQRHLPAVVASWPLIAISGQVSPDASGRADSLVQVSVLVHSGVGSRSNALAVLSGP